MDHSCKQAAQFLTQSHTRAYCLTNLRPWLQQNISSDHNYKPQTRYLYIYIYMYRENGCSWSRFTPPSRPILRFRYPACMSCHVPKTWLERAEPCSCTSQELERDKPMVDQVNESLANYVERRRAERVVFPAPSPNASPVSPIGRTGPMARSGL